MTFRQKPQLHLRDGPWYTLGMTTNRKTIQVEIDDSPASPLRVGFCLAFGLAMIPTLSYMMVYPITLMQVVGILLINLVLSIIGGVLYVKLKPARRVAFITLDADDLIPPQADEAVVVEEEPAEEPEPEADESEDDSPAEPQWFETPYPDPDAELKADEAPKA